MEPAIISAFFKFTELEGRAYSMYLDRAGHVMTGADNLIDPAPTALALPWRLPDGNLASKAEIGRQWQTLKARQDLAKVHHTDSAKLTTIRLTEDDVDTLVAMKLLANEPALRAALPGWEELPADAKLACCSLAWADAARFASSFRGVVEAANRRDFGAAKLACKKEFPGYGPRHSAHERCFANAAFVIENARPLDVLHWPNAASAGAQPAAEHSRAETALQRAAALAEEIDEAAVSRRDFLRELGSDS